MVFSESIEYCINQKSVCLITDINECQVNPTICGAYAICENEEGSHNCKCISGYRMNAKDECKGKKTFLTWNICLLCEKILILLMKTYKVTILCCFIYVVLYIVHIYLDYRTLLNN